MESKPQTLPQSPHGNPPNRGQTLPRAHQRGEAVTLQSSSLTGLFASCLLKKGNVCAHFHVQLSLSSVTRAGIYLPRLINLCNTEGCIHGSLS